MTRQPVTVRPETTIAHAADMMASHRIRRLLVVASARLCGLVSQYDVARAFPPGINPFGRSLDRQSVTTSVGSIMTRNLLTTTPEAPIEDAARIMRTHKVGGLPVLKGHHLEGIITESDLFRAMCELLGADRGALRITFDVTHDQNAVAFTLDLAQRHGMRTATVMCLEHEGKRLAIVRLVGREPNDLIQNLWKSGHRVVSVLRP